MQASKTSKIEKALTPKNRTKMSQSKQDLIDERKANLPLPDQPPTSSDWTSASGENTNVGSGFIGGSTNDNFREPVTGDSAVRTDGEEWNVKTDGMENVGRQGKDGLSGLPGDAVSRGKKGAEGTVGTTGKDYGYPERNDPSSGLK
jgi:hypothetical protein